MSEYRKFLTALVGVVVAFATLVVTSESGPITSSEWLSGGIGLATALGVYGVSNEGGEDGSVEPGSCALGIAVGALVAWFILRR